MTQSLGKGLEAIIPGWIEKNISKDNLITSIPINQINTGTYQPRQKFDEKSLQELGASIKDNGMIQPVVVTKTGDKYNLIAGERRLKASELIGLSEIPAIIKEYSEEDSYEIALIENLQREDLNPIEEALGFAMLIEKYKLSQEMLAIKMKKSRSAITNALRLLELPEDIREHIKTGIISAGHGRALLGIEDAAKQLLTAQDIINKGLSVRDVERIARNQSRKKREDYDDTAVAEQLKNLEKSLTKKFKTDIAIKGRKSGQAFKGNIKIKFNTQKDLDRILALLS